MKFICEHDKVYPLLQEWAGESQLISASFFFWRIGSTEQKSLQGLIRGLLFAIVQQEPIIAKLLFPRLWETNNPKRRPLRLSDREISQAFDKMTAAGDLIAKYRMCFFVDGLDEL